jgi:hypothetical protein
MIYADVLMRKAKDGGPESPVDADFLFEIKSLGSVALMDK